MDNSLEKLLQKTLELEGLVALALKRGEDTPDMVLAMISDKANAVAASANAFVATATMPKATEEASAEPEMSKSADCSPESIDTLPDDEPDDDITVELVDEPEEENSSEELSETESAEKAEKTKAEAEEPSTEAPVVATQQKPTNTAFTDNQDLSTTDDDKASESKEEIEDDLTLDEALQRDMTKDLRHAFSLNDRYRYRRELFGNSDSVMNETLNLVETMHSFDEAEDYFYNDLQWEHDSPEVADFMVIIKNHFWNKRQQV